MKLKIRPPANSSLGQLIVEYKKIPLSLFDELSRAFPEIDWSNKDVFHISNSHPLPFGHFVVVDRLSKLKTYFMKSVERNFSDEQMFVNELVCFAGSHCSFVIRPCTAAKIVDSNGISFSVEYSLWENLSEIPLDPVCFQEAGKDLADLHRTLNKFPKREMIQINSYKYFERLNLAWEHLLNLKTNRLPGPDPKQLQKALQIQSIKFNQLMKNAQPIHGDLNNGNALWSSNSTRIRILDFEESIRTFLSPIFDLALFIERNIVVRIPDNPTLAITCGRSFLAGYQIGGGFVDREENLPSILIWMNQRALCLNAMCALSNNPLPDSEWGKFFTRIRHLSAEKTILSEIWKD